MSFRARLIAAFTGVTVLTFGAAFAAISISVSHSQERELDYELLREAYEEAREAASIGGQALAISVQPGPNGNDTTPLTKYGAIYGAGGALLAATDTFHPSPPPLAAIAHPLGVPFDLRFRGEHLRATIVPVPKFATQLLLATPRTDLDRDFVFLARAMMVGFVVAIGWSALLATWLVRRLTHDHRAIAEIAKRVASGDLAARVITRSGDRELSELSHNINDMIARLELLVTSQQKFVAHAAHELRSPLTTLYGELSHALRRSRDADSYRHAIEEALGSATRLKSLAEDLLSLARLGAEHPTSRAEVRLEDVLQHAASSVTGEARRRGVELNVRTDDATVEGGPRDLERMVRNLIENAIRHSPKGGRVFITASEQPDAVEIRVTDEGPGVSAEEADDIFEPFYRGARDRAQDGGAGLGLPIVRQIARAHQGTIRLENAGMPGAVFVVGLPKIVGSGTSSPQIHGTSAKTLKIAIG